MKQFSRAWGDPHATDQNCNPSPDSVRILFCQDPVPKRNIFGAEANVQYMYFDDGLCDIQLFYDQVDSALVLTSLADSLGDGSQRGDAIFWIGDGMSVAAGSRPVPGGSLLLVEVQNWQRYKQAEASLPP